MLRLVLVCFSILGFYGLNGSAKQNFFEQFPNSYFVETGSAGGTSIEAAIKARFPKIHSIELSEKYYNFCTKKFADFPNVYLWKGDSGVVLEEVIESIEDPITFWLDGHYSSGDTAKGTTNTPLLRELEIIKKHPIKTHTILIDDVRLFGTEEFDFISLSRVVELLLEINPNYYISYMDGFCQNDILVARVL